MAHKSQLIHLSDGLKPNLEAKNPIFIRKDDIIMNVTRERARA